MGEHDPAERKRPTLAIDDLESNGFGKDKKDPKRRYVEKQPVIEGPFLLIDPSQTGTHHRGCYLWLYQFA